MTPLDDQHDELRDLLTDAVSDVDPSYRLGEIRARVHRPARRGWYAVGGAILAAAVVVTAVNLSENDGGRRDREPGPATDPELQAVPIYYVGQTTRGPLLYREFKNVDADADPMTTALQALTERPDDRDYTSLWMPGSFTGEIEKRGPDVVDVHLGAGSDLVSGHDGTLAVQQVVYTVQAVLQDPDISVDFSSSGAVQEQVNGPVDLPATRLPSSDVLAQMSITYPFEGARVHDSFVGTGRNNGFEANFQWQILQGKEVVLDGFGTAAGWGDRLYPWETDPIDVSSLEPGRYTFRAQNDDPSGEGITDADTRTIIVE